MPLHWGEGPQLDNTKHKMSPKWCSRARRMTAQSSGRAVRMAIGAFTLGIWPAVAGNDAENLVGGGLPKRRRVRTSIELLSREMSWPLDAPCLGCGDFGNTPLALHLPQPQGWLKSDAPVVLEGLLGCPKNPSGNGAR